MANKINLYNSSAIYDSMVKDGFLKADKLSKEKFLTALENNPKYMPRVRAYAQRVYGMSPEDFDNLVYTTDYTQDVSQLPPSGSPDYAPSMPWDNTPAQFSLPYTHTKPDSDNNLPGLPAHDNTSQPNLMRDFSPENVTRRALANATPQPMQYLPKEEWDKEIRKKEAIQKGLQEIAAHSTRSTTDFSQPISVKSVTHPSDLTLGEWYNAFASDTYSIQKEAGRIYQMWQVGAIDEDEARSRFHQLYVSPQTAQSRNFVRSIDERRNFRRNNAAIDAAEAEIASKLQAAAAQKPTQPIPMPYMGDARISDSIDEQYYKQSLRFLDDARKISRAYADNNYNGTSTAKRVLRGIGDNLITPEAITMGFSAIADNANLMRILEKDERGEQLSDAEETLLSAAIIKQYTEAAYASGAGIAYNIGAVTGESLPYMLSFVATGIPVKAATSGISKRIVNFVGRQLQRKGIGRAATRATKTTLGLGGNIATSALQAPIMPSTYSDYLDRRIGTIDSTTDDMGNIRFSHQGDSRSDAALKAYFNTFYQNFGERSGEAISSLWGMFGRGIGKIPIGRGKSINDIFDTIHNSRLGKFWDVMQGTAVADFMRRANYDGVFAEVAEEYVSGFLNAATIGDQSFEELFSQDNLLTTMGGIALTSVMLGSANATLGVAATQRIRTNFNRSSKAAQQYFSPEQFNQLIAVSGGSVQDITTFLAANIARRQLIARQISQLAARQRKGETGIEAQINTLGAELQDLRMQYDFVNASAMYNAYIGGLSRRIEPMREQARKAIRANGDPATGLTIQVNVNGRQGYLIGGNYNHIQDSDGNISVTPTGDLATVLFDGDKTPTPNIPMETISILGVRRTDDVIRDGDRAIFAATEQEENAAQAPATGSTVTVSGSQGNFILQGYDPQGNAIVTPLNSDGTPAVKNGNPITASVPSENIIPEEAGNTSASLRSGSIAYIDGIPYSVDQVDGENAIIHRLNTDGTPINDEQGNPVTSIVPTATLSSSPHPAQTVEPQNIPDEQQPTPEQQAAGQDAAIEETNTQQQPAIVDDNITETPSSALSRIPIDKKGKPIYEQSDPETAYDAILEQAEGDTALASRVILSMIDNKEAALNKLSKAKPRRADNPADIIKAEKELAAQIKQAESNLQFWKNTALVPSLRNQAQKEAEANSVIQNPSLADTPDITDDSPSDARKRGFRRYAGSRIDRSEPLHPARGNAAEIRFSAKQVIPVHAAVIEADEIIPSHINGQRNPKHFLDEAQPKERTDQASVMAARQIAADLRPEEITSLTTAYSGAPVINARGEVIQGNNRSAALREMWSSYPEQAARYRQYLIDHAAQLGIDPASIQNMKAPVLVAIADVSDQEGIRLGQYTQTDLESGGTERIKPQNAITAMGNNVKNFANILLQSTDENASLSELLDRNALAALKWMQAKGYITPTQYQSAVDARGNVTAEAKNDLRNILFSMSFKGAAPQLRSMFDNLPARAQRAILTTAYRDMENPEEQSLIPELQNSIRAFHYLMQYPAFAAATNYKDARSAIEAWKRQFAIDDVTGDSFLPAEKFSNFALLLAASYKGCPQSLIQNIFTGIYDIIQGSRQPNLFETIDNTPKSLQEAINTTIQELLPQEHNFNYNGTTRSNLLAGNSATSQQPRQGSDGTSTSGERAEDRNEQSNRGTGTDRDSETSSSANGDVGLRDSDRSGTERPADEGQGGLPQSKGIRLSAEEVASLLSQMEDNATAAPHVELSEETWSREFPDGNVSTPMGVVKFGENQLAKLFLKKRQDEFGMLKPTLENPDVVINEPSQAKNGAQGERKSSYLFVKTFIYGGKKVKYYTSVTVLKDGMEVVISNHISGRNAIEKKMQENEILHLNEKYSPNSSDRHLAEHSKSVPDLLPTQGEYMSSPEGNTSSISHADDAAPAISLQSRDDVISSDSKDTVNSKDTQDLGEKIAAAEAQTDTNPTEAQKEAGNYRKGHVQIGQFNVSIENPKGSVRSGVDVTGREWTHTMQNTYGYIRGTEGVDGDHIDVFLANDIDGWNGSRVFVIDQYNEDGTFDEHKVMIGFNDEADAQDAYLSNYEKGWENKRKLVMTSVNLPDFENWINSSHRKTKPFAEYQSVNGEQKSVTPADRIKEINARLSELKERAAEARRSNDIISEARIITESNNLNAELRSLEAETKQRSISKRNLERSKLPLTEKEYANKRSEEIRKSNPDIDEIDAYNQAIDEYPSYILDKIRNGELEKIYEQASINDRIKLGRMVESAGYSVSDISSLANKKRQDEKNQNVHNIGERVTIRFYDGTIIKGDIISTGNGSVTVLNEEDKRKYTVPESRILSHQTNKEEIPNSNTPTKQARNLPGMLKEAYRQGNASDIAKSEADLRAHIESQSDLKKVAVTYFRSKDNMRQYKDENSPEYRMNKFIADACKNALLKAGIAKEALMGERKRVAFASTTDDARTLDVMSIDPSYDVLRAVIRNPHTSDSVLRDFTERFQNNGLDYEAQQVLDERRNKKENSVRDNTADADATVTNKQDNNAASKQTKEKDDAPKERIPKAEKIEDVGEKITNAEAQADTNPTEAQKEAGNYRKGHLRVDSFDITIENPKGSVRSGTDAAGNPWSITMHNTYGYIRRTEGVDGDHIDVFLSDNPTEGNVYIVDQINQQTGEFDEHKVMYGFNSIEEAKSAYLSNYSKGWKIGTVTEVSKEEFKKWINSSHRKTKPFAEYTSIKTISGENGQETGTLDTAFDNLFNAIQEEVDATTGSTILFRELTDQSTTQEQTNDRFNDELSRQIDGTLPKGHIYDLGMPSDTLLNAGLPNLPIEMAASRLSDKSMQENHPFDLSEIRNLPKAIQSPMAIFRSATRLGSFVVMTEIEHHGRNFVVAIQANRRKGRIEVNDIRSVHYRTSNSHIANWVTEGLLEYADKKRMVEWLSKQRYNSAEVRKLFNHATNIIQNFDNPKNNNENIRLRDMAAEVADAARPAQVTRQIERLAREMNLPIEIIHAIDDIPDAYTRRYIQGEIDGQPHTIAGYYDRTTGKAYIILPAILQTADPLAEAERTILHEVIAHHGMQALMGRDAYDTLCDEVWQSLPSETRARFAAYVLRKRPGNLTITDIARVAASPALRRAAADEYIAALAEGGVENPTLWQRIKAFFRAILRRMHLYSINPTDADIRYLLSQARENLAQTSTESVHRGTDNTGAFSSENPDIRYAYTEFNGRAMSENAKKALEDGKTDVGKELDLAYFIEESGLGTWEGEYHHVGKNYNLHYFVKLNDGVTLPAARKAFKKYLEDKRKAEIKAVLDKYPDAMTRQQVIDAGGSVFLAENRTHKDIAYAGGEYWYIPITIQEQTNDRFNNELQQQIDGTLPEGHIYQLGRPGEILLSAGFPDMPIEMSATRLAEKSQQKNHPFDISAVRDLVKNMNDPIAVFKYGNNAKNVIIGIEYGGKQFLVGVHFNQSRHGVEVNDIRGIFPKDNSKWLNWISQGKADYLNKEEIQALIDKQRTNLAEVEYLDLDSVTKIIQNFDNPKPSDTDIRFRELSVPEETIDNASRQGNDYARDARTHAAASIDTHSPDLSPVEQAEAVRFRELLTRDFSAASDFLNSANLINAAMQANDGKAAWLNNIQEAVFDSMLRLRLLLDRMKKDGASIPAGFNPYLAENQSRSRAQDRIAAFNEDYRRPLIESLAKCINKLREENIGVAIKDNNAAHEALSLYAQARAAVERQEVKEREAREQAKADGTEYKHREWAGLPGIQYAIIALYKGEITDDVEANKNNLLWLQDFATENNIPTVEQYITMVEDALQKENIDNLWENIRRISEFQLTTSRDAGILSRGSYQLLTYGYNIDDIIETLYKEQRKKITDDINNGIGDKDSLAADLADLDRRHLEAVATATDLDAPDAITTLVAGGWITQDIANDIHRYYNYYLPLKGHAEITGEDLFDYNTPSMPRNASRIKSVRGHEQLARDPFNQILRDAEGCIVQAERNRWKQQLYHVLSTNRSLANGQYAIQRKYYQVIKLDDGTVRYEPYQRVVTTENNEDIITFVPTSEEIAAGTAVLLNSSAKFDIYVSQKQRSEHETIVYIDGSPISILFYDARIAKAVNGTNEAYPPQWMPRAIIQASRTIPALLTSWNPEFVLLSNPIRDTQEAIANAAIDKGFKYTALLARNLATVDRDLWAYTGGKLKQKKDNGQPLSQYEKYVTEFFENGGAVNITQLADYDTTTKDLRKELKRAIKGRTRPSKNFWKRLTEQTELRTRIATYITSRQTGSTIQDAINDAKEITVNFDRRGAQFRNFNLLQMFFNAQMQSVRRQTELMRRHPVRYATTVAILTSSKVLIGLGISLLLGGGDDDNSSAEDIIRRYFEINKQLRTRNHIFIIDGEVYRIPVAPAFIPFTTLCEEAAQLAFDPSSRHRNTASQALLSVTSSVLETYVPTLISDPANIMININNEQAWRQSFASGIPMSGRALWQPFIEAIYNYDYTGNPIYTEPQFGAQHLPFHRDYRERTGKAYVYTSKLLSDLTGGNNIIPGKINIHPEQIEQRAPASNSFTTYPLPLASTEETCSNAKTDTISHSSSTTSKPSKHSARNNDS